MSDDPQPTPHSAARRMVCPQCKARYLSNREITGRRVRCRHCGHVWRDTSKTVVEVAGALGAAAQQWPQVGSTLLAATDHASTVAHLVSELAAPKGMPAGEWIGRTLGRYQIKAVLGQGAMGNVYEALDPELQRVIALKVLPRKIDPNREPVGLKMFLQEARVAARLQHPGVVTIYEVGKENGVYFFAMERVQGTTLYHLVEAMGPLPAQQACYVIAHAARALAAGHAMGIVHRDVKPGNIMIDNRGLVKVTDFGLADVSGADSIKELSEKSLGTPGWISPEVARGEKATPASDIYGLGLTVYYAMTRKRLIRAATRSGMVRLQSQAKSVRIEELPESWPPRLKQIVAQCLQADPKDRYDSADILAFDLLRALAPDDDKDNTVILDTSPAPGNKSVSHQTPGATAKSLHLLRTRRAVGAAIFFIIAVMTVTLLLCRS